MSAQHRWILCGGLASGKSQVRGLLDEAGLATIDADSIGHAVIEPSGAAYEDVAGTWPGVVKGGRIDRRALAEIVFNDPYELSRLETLTHPHILEGIRRWADQIDDVAVVELPLLGKLTEESWRLMVVDANEDVRLARAVGRGMDEADARARMARQPTRGEWLAHADLVIPNHGDVDDLKATVVAAVPHLGT